MWEGSTRYHLLLSVTAKTGWPLADMRLHFCALIQAFGLSPLLRRTPLWGLPPAQGLWADHALSAHLLSKPAIRHLVQEYPHLFTSSAEVISRTRSALCAPLHHGASPPSVSPVAYGCISLEHGFLSLVEKSSIIK